MRAAIVSDIHGNLTAFEAVVADLRQTSPDLILHGGDLPQGGARPAEIVDRIRELGWHGVLGNTDEMLFRPESLEEFAAHAPHLESLWTAIREMAKATCEALGEERIAWLEGLPMQQIHEGMTLLHASPETTWRAPAHTASDGDLEKVYAALGTPVVVYGHTHYPYVRRLQEMMVVNSGSVGLPYDGDRRAAYLLMDDGTAQIRRVEYDVEREVRALAVCGLPHADWVRKMLESAGPQMPS